jgi:hypothetical protein
MELKGDLHRFMGVPSWIIRRQTGRLRSWEGDFSRHSRIDPGEIGVFQD